MTEGQCKIISSEKRRKQTDVKRDEGHTSSPSFSETATVSQSGETREKDFFSTP
jgi:hypothetical protein